MITLSTLRGLPRGFPRLDQLPEIEGQCPEKLSEDLGLSLMRLFST